MIVKLDLMALDDERFQLLCTRIARRSFPSAMPLNFASWDGGRDIVQMVRMEGDILVHDVVWQAKFTQRLDGTTKKSIKESIATIRDRTDIEVTKWILCLPVDPTGPFLDWLVKELSPTGWQWEIWGESILWEKLEANPDIIESFFYPIFEELQRYFAVEKLELVRLELDRECQWAQVPGVLHFGNRGFDSPDLVFDVIVRNSGRVDAVLLALEARVFDWEPKAHGIPPSGLLLPKITYNVSLGHGQAGTHRSTCEPPLVVKAGGVERFKIRLTDTGYSWRGSVAVFLDYGGNKRLRLPTVRLYT